MREIEFRIKSYHGDWYYGLPIHFSKMSNTCAFQSFDNSFYDAFADRETLGQYTGLTDKNGTKIFEGDIVRINGWWYVSGPAGYEKNMTVVKYDNEVCGFTPMCNYDTDCGVFHSAEKCEVIGNVFDNPELLEKVEE